MFVLCHLQKNEKLPTADFDAKKVQESRRLAKLKVTNLNSVFIGENVTLYSMSP